jgi:hypothetical protein
VPVRWALAQLVGAALAVALPCSLAATVLSQAQLCGGGGAGAVGTGAPRGSFVGRRTPLFPGCCCLDERSCGGGGAGAVALAHLVGVALADALPCSLAASALMSAAMKAERVPRALDGSARAASAGASTAKSLSLRVPSG